MEILYTFLKNKWKIIVFISNFGDLDVWLALILVFKTEFRFGFILIHRKKTDKLEHKNNKLYLVVAKSLKMIEPLHKITWYAIFITLPQLKCNQD